VSLTLPIPSHTIATIPRSSKKGRRRLLVPVRRSDLSPKRVLILYVRAGGRCEFCKKYLLKHSLTQTVANFGEVGHIYSFSKKGPRGGVVGRPRDIHDLVNLMLLCDECHKLIDGSEEQYPVPALIKIKQGHEDDVYNATGVIKSQKTAIIRLEAPINGQQVAIPITDVYKAIKPRFPLENSGCHIDLNQLWLSSTGPEFTRAASAEIKARVREMQSLVRPAEPLEHLSIFGLAPIPLLILLGNQLGNTIPADVYQHHHDTNDWVWKTGKPAISFRERLLRSGKDKASVALCLSISGTIELASLPPEIDDRFSVYELAPFGVKPSKNCVTTKETLENFKRAYEEFRRNLRRNHYPLDVLHLFPAVPPPVAILSGREMMPKVDPALHVYDFNKSEGFKFSLEVDGNVR
jgi:SMODS-associated and fused to various effectors sensor domain